MIEILQRVKEMLPDDAKISNYCFEGANIILYTKNKEFFLNNGGIIRGIVDTIKKRVELRPDPSLTLDVEKAEEIIRNILSKEVGELNIIFDPQRSIVIIEAEKPGIAIGKRGEVLKEIKDRTIWVPLVRRIPAIRSKIIENIRQVLYENNDYRKKFLNKVGERIYGNRKSEKKTEWIRLTFLGGAREVGRSSLFLQTPESKILIDCGVNVAATTDEKAYPYFNIPEFDVKDIDAIIVSHQHLDHCLAPESHVLMADGSYKTISEVKEGDKLMTVNWKKGTLEPGTCVAKSKTTGHKKIKRIKTPYSEINTSPNHRFFKVEDLEIKEVEAQDLEIKDLIPLTNLDGKCDTNFVDLNINLNDDVRLPLTKAMKEEFISKRIKNNLRQLDVNKQLNKGLNFAYYVEKKCKSIRRKNLNLLLSFYNINTEEFYNKHKLLTLPKKLTPELAKLLGYIAGDGHKSNKYSVVMTDGSYQTLVEYRKLINKIFDYDAKISRHSDKTKKAFVLKINNKRVLDYLEKNFPEVFFDSGTAVIPEKVIRSNLEVQKYFLRGIFDAEGSVTKGTISIFVSSNELLSQIRFALLKLGIPATLIYKNKKVNVASKYGFYKFKEKIGFTNIKKSRRLNKLTKRPIYDKEDLIPIKSEDLKKILSEVRIIGRAYNNPGFKCLPSSIVDWHMRKGNAYATRRTVKILVNLLENRVVQLNELRSLTDASIKEIRQTLSLSRIKIAESLGISQMQLQYRENNSYVDTITSLLRKHMIQELENTIITTLKYINKIKLILNIPARWSRITTIETLDNEYDHLVDIEVSPNRNFISNGIVVHNSALVPLIFKYGYNGPVYCTAPTRDIMALLWLDFISIAQKEAKKALYTAADVKEVIKHTICLDFEEVTDITPDVRLTLYNSGHALGSAMCHLHIGEGLHNLLYSADMNYEQSNLLDAAVTKFPRLETVILEGTYGGKEDTGFMTREEAEHYLLDVIKKTLERGGKVLLPTLGVGRSQEIMLVLEKAVRQGLIEKIPVYVQGMVWDVTAIHTAYPDFFSNRVKKLIFHKDTNPFLSDMFKRVGSRKEMMQIVEETGPCVIMATSGMMVGGPSVEYFKHLASNPKNSLVFTCYQGIGSLGRRIQSGEKEIAFSNDGNKQEIVKVNLEIHSLHSFTGHSTREQLINFVRRLSPQPKKIIVNHGDGVKCIDLASSLHKMFGLETIAPKDLDTIRIR